MKVNKFLQERIKELTTAFKEIKCSYKFDAANTTHYIEILPPSQFNNSADLKCAQADIYDLFDDKYPNECLVFISSDSLTKITEPSFVLAGDRYGRIATRILWFNELEQFSKTQTETVGTAAAGDNNYALAA